MAASALMNVMIGAARKAGRGLDARLRRGRAAAGVGQRARQLRHRRRPPRRGDHLRELSKARPGYGFLMEERGVVAGRRQDPPLDRRPARRHHQLPARHPACSASRSRWSARARSSRGVIYNPIIDELFTAEKGRGAFLNDAGACASRPARRWPTRVIATGIPHRGRPGHARFLASARHVMDEVAGCAAPAPPPSILPGSPPGASTATWSTT